MKMYTVLVTLTSPKNVSWIIMTCHYTAKWGSFMEMCLSTEAVENVMVHAIPFKQGTSFYSSFTIFAEWFLANIFTTRCHSLRGVSPLGIGWKSCGFAKAKGFIILF